MHNMWTHVPEEVCVCVSLCVLAFMLISMAKVVSVCRALLPYWECMAS